MLHLLSDEDTLQLIYLLVISSLWSRVFFCVEAISRIFKRSGVTRIEIIVHEIISIIFLFLLQVIKCIMPTSELSLFVDSSTIACDGALLRLFLLLHTLSHIIVDFDKCLWDELLNILLMIQRFSPWRLYQNYYLRTSVEKVEKSIKTIIR